MTIHPPTHFVPCATGPISTCRSKVQVPICVPSAEQTVWPAAVHEVVEAAAGAEEGCCCGAIEEAGGATTAGGLELSEDGAAGAAAEGAMAATFSWTAMVGKAAAGADDEGCAAGGALDWGAVLSPEPWPPGTVQPMGVHSMPGTLPSPSGATVVNKEGVTSMLLKAQAMHVSLTVATVSVPVVGLWIEICLPQRGLSFGLPGFVRDIMPFERATTASLASMTTPQEAGEISGG